VIPADAASYCAAHIRQETLKDKAKKHAPAQFGHCVNRSSSSSRPIRPVREKNEFDMEKMSVEARREHRAALESIFAKYGVPRTGWWGAGRVRLRDHDQHQSPEFRHGGCYQTEGKRTRDKPIRVLMRWCSTVSRSDAGKKQMYGENLICDSNIRSCTPRLSRMSCKVNERRAAIGLMRLELYAQLVVAMMPNVCPAAAEAK